MRKILLTLPLALLVGGAKATELTHRFESPSFGGNPLNGTFLLNQANEQNTFKEKSSATKATNRSSGLSGTPSTQKSQLEIFKENIQRAILNKLAYGSTTDLFDKNGNIVLGSHLSFDLDGDGNPDFSIVVDSAPTNGNVTISISDGISDTKLTVPYTASSTTP